MELQWAKKLWQKKLVLFFAIPLFCGLIAAGLSYYEIRSSSGYESSERLYDRDIRARIGPYAPYAYLNKGGAVGGYVMDLTFAICRDMGVRVALRSRKLDDLSTIMAMQDTVAVLCLVETPTTKEVFDFSPPYATHMFALFARKDAPAVSDHKTLSRRASFVINTDGIYYDLNKVLFSGRTPGCTLVESAEEAMQKLASGECQYTIMESYIGKTFLDQSMMKDVEMVRELDEKVEYCFAVRKGNPEVLKVFTDGLRYLQLTGQFDKIQKQWVEPRFLISRTTLYSIAIYFTITFIIILAVMLFLYLWFHLLKRQVSDRTYELEIEIEERKKAQEQLLASQAQLMQADKMAAIGTMATGIAHEINSPNALILLHLPLLDGVMTEFLSLSDPKLKEEGDFEVAGIPYSVLRTKLHPLLGDMQHASLRIKEIVEDLKNFVRIDSNDELDGRTNFDLNKVVQSSLRLLDNEVHKSTEHFSVHYGENLPLIYGSAQKIEQVVLNLVINACQALQKRQESIVVETGQNIQSREIFLKVKDQGSGIHAEHVQHLFNPFFTTKRKHGGTGLGLFISQKIVKAHHGRLELRSLPNQGAVAMLYLPFSSAEHDVETTLP